MAEGQEDSKPSAHGCHQEASTASRGQEPLWDHGKPEVELMLQSMEDLQIQKVQAEFSSTKSTTTPKLHAVDSSWCPGPGLYQELY